MIPLTTSNWNVIINNLKCQHQNPKNLGYRMEETRNSTSTSLSQFMMRRALPVSTRWGPCPRHAYRRIAWLIERNHLELHNPEDRPNKQRTKSSGTDTRGIALLPWLCAVDSIPGLMPLEIKDEALDLVFDTKTVFPSPSLVPERPHTHLGAC